MAFQIHIPAEPLSHYVECLWYQQEAMRYTRETIIPTGTIEIIINLGVPHRVLNKDDYSRFDTQRDAWVAGFQTEHLIIESDDSHMIGARLKAGGAYPFFPFPIADLNNAVIPLDLIWGAWISDLRERILAATTIPQRFALLSEALMQRLNTDPYGVRTVEAAVRLISRSHAPLNINTLSDHLGISHKHLITQFKRVVGVSPKQLSRIVRLNRALYTIDPAASINWASIAAACHYYDQAHFNRDFLAMTGLTPSGYLEQRATYLSITEQREDVHFVPIG